MVALRYGVHWVSHCLKAPHRLPRGGGFPSGWLSPPLGEVGRGLELRTFLKAGERNINVTLSLTPGTSAIKSTNGNRQEEGVYYSLNGQKLRVTDGSMEMKANSPSKGIYVKNGKKVVIL